MIGNRRFLITKDALILLEKCAIIYWKIKVRAEFYGSL